MKLKEIFDNFGFDIVRLIIMFSVFDRPQELDNVRASRIVCPEFDETVHCGIALGVLDITESDGKHLYMLSPTGVELAETIGATPSLISRMA